jgi:hypothetical protein
VKLTTTWETGFGRSSAGTDAGIAISTASKIAEKEAWWVIGITGRDGAAGMDID